MDSADHFSSIVLVLGHGVFSDASKMSKCQNVKMSALSLLPRPLSRSYLISFPKFEDYLYLKIFDYLSVTIMSVAFQGLGSTVL